RRQALAEARSEYADAGVDLELRAVRVTHDSVARGVEIRVATPCHLRALVRTHVAIHAHDIAATDDEDRVVTDALRVEPATVAVDEILAPAESRFRHPVAGRVPASRRPSAAVGRSAPTCHAP